MSSDEETKSEVPLAKVLKLVEQPIIPLSVIDPNIFRAIEGLAKTAIQYGDNCPAVRAAVASVVTELRMAAKRRFGHDSADVLRLVSFLKSTRPFDEMEAAKRVRRSTDPVMRMFSTGKIDEEQMGAAHLIREVWSAMERGLSFKVRKYEPQEIKGSSRGFQQPIEWMSQELYEVWKHDYTAWYQGAIRRFVQDREATHRLHASHAAVVLRIVVEGVDPAVIDIVLKVRKGTALKILKRELDYFNGKAPSNRSMFSKRKTDATEKGNGREG